MKRIRLLLLSSATAALPLRLYAACGFEAQADLARFTVSRGAASISAEQRHDGVSSLKVEPGAKVEMKFSEKNVSGRMEVWVYDTMQSPADPKSRFAGARWGLLMADGTELLVAQLFAPYLSGDQTYVATQPQGNNLYHNLQFLGESRRSEGWHRWTFAMDPDKGLSIALDGRDVNAARVRFDWNKTAANGFAGIVLYGAQLGPGSWPVWFDDLTLVRGGPMRVAPTPPAPDADGGGSSRGVAPEKDPPPASGHGAALPPAYLKAHPRLLFSAADLPKMRAFAKSASGRPLLDRLSGYQRSSVVPADRKFLRDATDAQRQGLWRLPTLVVHYALTDDKASRDRARGFLEMLNSLPHWEEGGELDCGMGAANMMVGAALAFDCLHDELDPGFREAFRAKLWQHARTMYYGGHLARQPGTHYWQNDPQNNHRWHRDAGLLLCALAAARGTPDEQWLLGKCVDELKFVVQWLPEDGTSHESGSYLAFGASHLVLALHAADRAFGTKFLEAPFFKSVGDFRMHSLLPDLRDGFSYGDGAGVGNYNSYLYKAAAVHRKPALAGALDRFYAASPSAFEFAWFDLVWRDPQLRPVDSLDRYPTAGFFDDIGTLFVRDSWKPDAAAAMFRCGPFGGYTLNRFRGAQGNYINVAHDDPDANSFVLVRGGTYLAETDRYSSRKKSANHNTVLVNGIGQEAAGRPEGGQWSQPAVGRNGMENMARVVNYRTQPGLTVIEGEAKGSYLALNDGRRKAFRPALKRFRRTFLWVEGRYVLVLDDLQAPSAVTYDWLLQGRSLTERDAASMRYELESGGEKCAVQLASSVPLSTTIRASSADNHGKALGWKQLVATAKTDDLKVASVYGLWGGTPEVTFDAGNGRTATVRVKHGSRMDVWTWEGAAGDTKPSHLALNGRSVQ